MSDYLHKEESHPLSLSEHARKNRAVWEATSDSYEQRHAASLGGKHGMAWGLWRIPEAELHILAEVAGKDAGTGLRRCSLVDSAGETGCTTRWP